MYTAVYVPLYWKIDHFALNNFFLKVSSIPVNYLAYRLYSIKTATAATVPTF